MQGYFSDYDMKQSFLRHAEAGQLVLLENAIRIGNELRSQFVFKQCDDVAIGVAQRTVGIKPLRNIIIPLPPLAEQKRIVAKLEELLPLCEG